MNVIVYWEAFRECVLYHEDMWSLEKVHLSTREISILCE
jgi:hypothetical protein